MPIAVLIPLLIQYGFPFAEKVIGIWHTTGTVTPDDWTALKALSQQTAKSQMLAALTRAGVDPTTPAAVALLAQVPA